MQQRDFELKCCSQGENPKSPICRTIFGKQIKIIIRGPTVWRCCMYYVYCKKTEINASNKPCCPATVVVVYVDSVYERRRIKRCTLSVSPSVPCLRRSRNRKDVETSNLVETVLDKSN